jgi:competence protein ComGC
MLKRLREERAQGMIEMIMAVVLITVALLALMASYDGAFMSLHKSARTNAAAQLADSQIELYSSLYALSTTNPTAQIGLSSSLLATAKASDAFYSTDESALSPSGTDYTNSSCTTTATQCMPVQTVTGSDGKSYRMETFTRNVTQTLTCTTTTVGTCSSTTTQRVVTVIIRDPNSSGTPKVYTATTAFDCGPVGSTACPAPS